MRGRLILEKLDIAIDEMAPFALANVRLLATPKKMYNEYNTLLFDLRANHDGNLEVSF